MELVHSGLDEFLKRHLATLSAVLDNTKPASAAEVAHACERISRWSEEHRLPLTAIAFVRAAALTIPESAAYAFTVGRLCRANSQASRAEAWYRRAIVLARRRGESEYYARACIGLGNLAIQRGDYLGAQMAFERAKRRARRAGLRQVRAEALHSLFTVAVESKKFTDAEMLARQASRAYGYRHPLLPVLAHDVAGFWLLQGFYARALPVFQAVAKIITSTSVRLQVTASVARAAGGAGDTEAFFQAWVETWQIIDDQPELTCATTSLLKLAYGSASLGDWERVDVAATYAVDLARTRREERVQLEAQALLDAARRQQFTDSHQIPPADPEIAEGADHLAQEFVRKLAVCASLDLSDPRIPC